MALPAPLHRKGGPSRGRAPTSVAHALPNPRRDRSTLTWLSTENTKTLRPNKNLSLCPGAVIVGLPQPFVVDSRAKQTYLCHNLLIPIANPLVYHSILHSGSDSSKEYGLHTFPKSVLQQLIAVPWIQWLTPFALPLHPPSGAAPEAAPARTEIPKNLTIRFGAHRASVYGSSAAAKTAPFTTSAKDPVRGAHARDFIQKPVQPKILDEEFPNYQKLLDGMATDPILVTLHDLPSLAATPSASRLKRSRALPAEGEGGMEDTGASGSGTHHGPNSPNSAPITWPHGTRR